MDGLLPLFQQVHSLILKAKHILLVSDGKPDGDSIGSTAGMFHWLQSLGKEVSVFSIEVIPSTLRFIDGVETFSSDPAIFKQPYDLVMTFDASDPARSGISAYLPNTPKGYTLVVFDHHATNPRYGDINIIDIKACSTCELVTRFLENQQVQINPQSATALLAGIMTDTSSFANSGTTSSGLAAASNLMKCGARFPDILRHLFNHRGLDALKLWGKALERLDYNPTWDMAITYFTQADIANLPNGTELVEGISNFLNASCGDADTILVLRELPGNKVKGSLRSIKRDISKLAQTLGGGGHKKAAGFVVSGSIKQENGHISLEIEKSKH